MMDIDGIGEETAEQLYTVGLVKNIADIYDLTDDRLQIAGRVGELTAQRIMRGIKASKEVPFERVIYSLSIPNVGETVAKKIAYATGDIDKLMNSTMEDLTSIDEIGSVIAESVISFFHEPINREIVERLRAAGLQMAISSDAKAMMSDKLAGKSIVISGVFQHHSRDEYKKLIEQNGGKKRFLNIQENRFCLCRRKYGPVEITESARPRHKDYQ